MSAQTRAEQQWESHVRMERIALLREQALDYTYPAGQAQAGIQLATVEVPWLLSENARLKAELADIRNWSNAA